MKTVDMLIAEYNALSKADKEDALGKYTIKALTSCVMYSDDPEEATLALGVLTYAAILADDRIADEELMLLYRGLQVSLGGEVDWDECQMIAANTLNNKEDFIVGAEEFAQNYLSMWKENDKEDVIMLCIVLCAIDGVISDKGKVWLNELVAVAN